jgi:hypothetical protein
VIAAAVQLSRDRVCGSLDDEPTSERSTMSWRPRKRLRSLPNGKTKAVWEARYKDARGVVRVVKPAWNGGKGTFELKREAQRAIDEAVAQPAFERASAVGVYLDRWLETRPR